MKIPSTIRRLHLEPDLARALAEKALEWVKDGALEDCPEGKHLCEAVRKLLRVTLQTDLGVSPAAYTSHLSAGLRTEAKLVGATIQWRDAHVPFLSLSGCLRHLMRLSLGWDRSLSLATEKRFAAAAERNRRIS
jgi:hypothetical protein